MEAMTKYEKKAVQCCNSESKAKNRGVYGKTHETPLKTNKQHEMKANLSQNGTSYQDEVL